MAVLQCWPFKGEKWDESPDPDKEYYRIKGFRLIHKLIYAVREIGRPAVDKIKEVLDEQSENVNAVDSIGSTPLIYACCIIDITPFRIEIIRLLIERGCNIDQQNDYGHTALHIASEYSKHISVQLLIDNGASIDLKDNYDNTAYDYGNDTIKKIIRNAPNNPFRQQALLRKAQPPPPDDDFLTIDI